MSGSIQILRAELPLTDEQGQLMDIVLRESERLNETIRSFLAYARPQRQSMTHMDVRQVITDTATLLQNSSERSEMHKIAVKVPGESVLLQADEGQIRQIVWNLATNGLRAMPDGGCLTLAAKSPTDAEPHVVISVADEGVGIAPEELEGIFQPFRGGFSRGTGLGLSIVHRIVSDYAGEVRVTSSRGCRHDRIREVPGGGCSRRPMMTMPTEIQAPVRDAAPASTLASRVLVVDDERSMRELLSIVLRRDGYEVLVAADGKAALDVLKRERVDVLITDIRMPELSGVEVLAEAKKIDPSIISIIMTAFASTDTAVDALRLGAADYVHKSPNAVNDLRLRVRKELERKRLQEENVLLKRALNTPHKFANIVGSSSPMMAVFELIETIAPTSSTVLITGESGTGKELVARAIHARSPRSDRPFVAVNCGALPDTLLDSELFGHMRGAFTGADTNKKGLLEVAEKGTIFLDEIGEMSSDGPGQAAARAAGAQVPPARRHRRGRGEHPDHRRDQSRSGEDGGGRRLPRGPVLSDQRDSSEAAGAAGAARRHSVAGRPLRREVRAADEEGPARDLGRGDGLPAQLRLARQRARAGERDRARGRPRADPLGPARQPPGSRSAPRVRRRRRQRPRRSKT